MNEYTGKKLGEVRAFANVSLSIFERGREALDEALGEDLVETLIEANTDHIARIDTIVSENGVADTTTTKSDKTSEKLTKLMEIYIGDEWDNAVEIFEWLGFFEGAAIVHWALVEGMNEVVGDSDLAALVSDALDYHHKELARVEAALKQQGMKKAGE